MLGIENFGSYFPSKKNDNTNLIETFDINEHFINKKIGVKYRTECNEDEYSVDIGYKAFLDLEQNSDFNRDDLDCLVVVTQTPTYGIPHDSAVIHSMLDLNKHCACFDISLGCSGYVYALSIIHSYMVQNGFTKGVLITADPYSKIINKNDKNTALLFGDAATATLISDTPKYLLGKFSFGTDGAGWENLKKVDGKFVMNGASVYNFATETVVDNVENLLAVSNLGIDDVDMFYFHQGSKYMVNSLATILGINRKKFLFGATEYGNTVSSSIPLLLKENINNNEEKTILISGFGVGLSWASAIITKIN